MAVGKEFVQVVDKQDDNSLNRVNNFFKATIYAEFYFVKHFRMEMVSRPGDLKILNIQITHDVNHIKTDTSFYEKIMFIDI